MASAEPQFIKTFEPSVSYSRTRATKLVPSFSPQQLLYPKIDLIAEQLQKEYDEINKNKLLTELEEKFGKIDNLNLDVLIKLLNYKKWLDRICESKPKQYFKNFCKKDNQEMLIKKMNGELTEQNKILSVCGNPFCKDDDCFKQKYGLATLLFSTYFYSRPHYLTPRGDTWVHISIGDKRQSQYTKEDMKDFKKRCFAFLKQVEKELGFRLKGILESDLAFDESKIGEELFNHNHGAFRPFGLSRDKEKFSNQLKEINAIAKKNQVMFNFIGFRQSKWLIDYFAKRHAGKFGHSAFKDKPSTAFRFADVMSSKHYYDNYLGRQKIFLYGFSRRERNWIKQNQKEILLRASNSATSPSPDDNRIPAIVLVYKNYLFETLICPKCQGTDSFKQEISLEEEKPPDKNQEEVVYNLVSFRGKSPVEYKILNNIIPIQNLPENSNLEIAEMDEFLIKKSKENKQNQPQKRFTRYSDMKEDKKVNLDFADRLNLLAFGKC